jgi:hypothetical protein
MKAWSSKMKHKSMKNRLFAMAVVMFCLCSLFSIACPDSKNFRLEVKKGLFQYLSDPNTSTLNISELTDVVEFYLSNPNTSAQDCGIITGSNSGTLLSEILGKTDAISEDIIPLCADGTMYGECSFEKPKFCYSGSLTFMCTGPDGMPGTIDDCGCPNSLEVCKKDGTCQIADIACTVNTDCGPDLFTGEFYCIGNSVYRDYMKWTCSNPGTPVAECSYLTEQKLVEACTGGKTCQEGNGVCV